MLLVDDNDAGLCAGVDIDGVVAGAARRHAQELGAARQQVGGGKPLPRQFVFRRRDQIDMRFREVRPDRAVRRLALAGAQRDVRFARKALVHGRVVGKVEADDDLRICGHVISGTMPTNGGTQKNQRLR